jgi:hypothetical protein
MNDPLTQSLYDALSSLVLMLERPAAVVTQESRDKHIAAARYALAQAHKAGYTDYLQQKRN